MFGIGKFKMTKRKLDKVDTFKDLLLTKGESIFQEEFGKITTRHPDKESMDFHVKEQTKVDEFTGHVMRSLYECITHIPASKLFEDIRTTCKALCKDLGNDGFYIFLTRSNSECRQKSNMFLAIMAMARNKQLTHGFVDFICGDNPLHHEKIDTHVKQFVYLDDVTFSGNQIRENIQKLSTLVRHDNLATSCLHIVIPYIQPSIMALVMEDTSAFGAVKWYTTSTYPKPVDLVIHDLILQHPQKDTKHVFNIVSKLLRSPHQMFHLSLFYTDLKIADTVSIFTEFLLRPSYLVKDVLVPSSEVKPIVTNCGASESPGALISGGNYCPFPVYKKEEWKLMMENILPKDSSRPESPVDRIGREEWLSFLRSDVFDDEKYASHIP